MHRKLIKDLYSTSLRGDYIGRLIQTAGSNLCDERPENRAKMAFGPVFKHIIRLEHFEMFFYVLTLT